MTNLKSGNIKKTNTFIAKLMSRISFYKAIQFLLIHELWIFYLVEGLAEVLHGLANEFGWKKLSWFLNYFLTRCEILIIIFPVL